MEFTFSKTLHLPFQQAIEKTTAALKEQGFGIISTIDLKEKFKEKLSLDFRNYTILGACNPAMAHKAIEMEDKIGVMLPCNVLVQEQEAGQVEVSAINPLQSIGGTDNGNLKIVATEVGDKLQQALQSL